MRIFSLDDRYKCLRTLDLNKYFAQHLESGDNGEIQEEPGLAVTGLCYDCHTTHSSSETTYDEEYHVTKYLKVILSVENFLPFGLPRVKCFSV